MNYILFDQSAVEYFASKHEYQSTEFFEGKLLTSFISQEGTQCDPSFFKEGAIRVERDGVMFIGRQRKKSVLVIDLIQCKLVELEKDTPENLLFVLQKLFRAAIHIWNHQPFVSSERVSNSKLVVFPFPYNLSGKNNKRLVIEREINSARLRKRGITFPLLVYKYNDETMSYGGDEIPDFSTIEKSGKAYADNWSSFVFPANAEIKSSNDQETEQIEVVNTCSTPVGDGGFRYLNYQKQYDKLTERQKAVVDFSDNSKPIRIVGPAGTGKTTSMILRAYKLLVDAKIKGTSLRSIFITHSESARYETECAFKLLDNADAFLSNSSAQSIEFITLFSFCKRNRGIKDVQTIDDDATDAKEYQLMLVEDAYKTVKENEYKAYKNYLSDNLKHTLENTEDNVLSSMLQHEFSVQIKGRADGLIDKYREIKSIKNGLPISTDENSKDKDFIYAVFQKYEKYLQSQSIYDTDDITIEALMSLNAPIWRRERSSRGYDYIFVDEIHLFNLNEQHVFHFLTKTATQSSIPICFALDYSQAIGDRGDLSNSYIERELSSDAQQFDYETVFRNSKYITAFCASLIASGVMLFQTDFIDPYRKSQSTSTLQDESLSQKPRLFMYKDEKGMIFGLKECIDELSRNMQCKNYKFAVISFDDSYLKKEMIDELEKTIGRNIYYLQGRNVGGLNKAAKENNSVILTSPYNINGLEFDAVLLFGVDGVRVPQSIGVSDISKNYLRYKAYNMLYLSSSRAKYQLYILGNEQNGVSECLEHSLYAGTLDKI